MHISTANSFLALPTELRLKVYSYFAADTSEFASLDPNDIMSANRGLLMTCSTIRHEALPEFLKMAETYYQAYEVDWEKVWSEQITIVGSDMLGHATVTLPDTPLAEEEDEFLSPELPLIYNSMESVTYNIPTRTHPTYGGPVFKVMNLQRYLKDIRPDKIAGVLHFRWDWIDLSVDQAKQWLKYEEDWNQMWIDGETNGTITLQLDAAKRRIKGVTWTHKPQKVEKA
jgi:hypothetical protein